MNYLISPLSQPLSRASAALYYKTTYYKTDEVSGTRAGCALPQGIKLSFDAYFNACFEDYYACYTSLRSLSYHSRCKGRFRISLVRDLGGGVREAVLVKEVGSVGVVEDVFLDLPAPGAGAAGRLFLELECLEDGGQWLGGGLVTEQPPARKVSLGVITCTYHKESYVKRTVSALLDDVGLRSKHFEVWVVDNGRTLAETDFADPRVRLIPNRNLGGSGGFNRGLIEAMHSSDHTHFLFMDDDIVLDSAVIYRLITLFEYAEADIAVCGAMFDLLRETVLFEAGAHYTPLLSTPLKHDLDLGEGENLDQLCDIEPIDYGGFWFFGFSRKLVERIGYPLPFFIKVDDMEYGLRIAADPHTQLVAFPGIGVWHEPFYAKTPIWDVYYYTRNNLIANTIHRRNSLSVLLAGLTRRVIGRVMLFDYASARMLVRGVQDFFNGSDHLRGLDSEAYHQEILAASRAYARTRQPLDTEMQTPATREGVRAWPMRLLAVVTLNGHLLPDSLLQANEPSMSDGSTGWSWIFGGRTAVFVTRTGGRYRNQMDRGAALGILWEWLALLGRALVRGGSVSRQWQRVFDTLRSDDFLCEYYGFEPSGRSVDQVNRSS